MRNRLLLIAGAVVVVIFGLILFSGKHVELKPARPVTAVASATTVVIQADGPHGVKAFSAAIEQDGQRQTVYEDKTKSRQTSRVYTFTAGKKQAAFLKEGPARLVIESEIK